MGVNIYPFHSVAFLQQTNLSLNKKKHLDTMLPTLYHENIITVSHASNERCDKYLRKIKIRCSVGASLCI